MYLNFQYREEMADAWRMYESETSDEKSLASPNAADTPGAAGSNESPTPKAGTNKRKGAPPPVTPKSLTESPEAKKKKQLDDVLTQRIKLKTRINATKSAAEGLISLINTNEGWGWARNAPNGGQLEELLNALKGTFSHFTHRFWPLRQKISRRHSALSIWSSKCRISSQVRRKHATMYKKR